MIERVWAAKIAEYAPRDALEQENVLAELLQHVVLAGLAKGGLCRQAELHGGTCLRLFHGLDRFSEDLDFVLKSADHGFRWERILEPVVRELEADGVSLEVVDRSDTDTDSAVKKAFLKTGSFGKLLLLSLPHPRDPRRKLRVKLEIDTDPPAGSERETHYLSFPFTFSVTTQTLKASFASKIHALLCRPYIKGRDWYDFLWYVNRGVAPNRVLLGNALKQHGPWAGQSLAVTPEWLIEALAETISRIDWSEAAQDVKRFLGSEAQQGLSRWDHELFAYHLEKLRRKLAAATRR